MSEDKTKITHSQDKARFLGYDITTAKNSALMYDSKHQLRKTHTGRIKLYAPRDKWQAKLIEYCALRIRYDENGKEIWDSHHRGNMVHMTDVEIVSQVNAEIRGMYNYYSIAENATVIKNFAFILEYSMYKTFGLKYQKSVYKIQRKYRSGMAAPCFYRSMCQRSRESLLRGKGTCWSASWSNACVYLHLVPHPVHELYPFGSC